MRLPFQFDEIDPGIRREIVYHPAADGFPLSGILYRPPSSDPDVALLAMHPRGDFTRHYLAPFAAAGGYAFFGSTSRYLHADADALHERLLLDVAGSISYLRNAGFSKVVLLGNSGGASLFSYYLEQAALPKEQRSTKAPSGDPVPLDRSEMPMADGFFALAAHPGQGKFLLDRLDPSVVAEDDPVAADPSLDMYDPANGYVPMTRGPSRYSEEFLQSYRAGQRARCARIDSECRAWIEEAHFFRKKLGKLEGVKDLDAATRNVIMRRGLVRRYRVVYRTLADPRYLDPTLSPSQRAPGSIFSFGRDPVAGNYGEGLARSMSARGWLSTWSGLSSRASLERTLPSVKIPFHLCNATADTDIYPEEATSMIEACGAEDKSRSELEWTDHYLNPEGEEGRKLGDPRARCAQEFLLPWLRERWPV